MPSTIATPDITRSAFKPRRVHRLRTLAACALLCSGLATAAENWQLPDELSSKLQDLPSGERNFVAVSYTHLTLPTIYSV